jgi:hypothetical protein
VRAVDHDRILHLVPAEGFQGVNEYQGQGVQTENNGCVENVVRLFQGVQGDNYDHKKNRRLQ